MLVLTRKEGQKVVIAHNITIEVIRISGNRITLGVEAPKDVSIRRNELKPKTASNLLTNSGAEQNSDAMLRAS